MRGELEAKAAEVGRGAALRQLTQIVVRLTKGEVAMRMEVWRSVMKRAADEQQTVPSQAVLHRIVLHARPVPSP